MLKIRRTIKHKEKKVKNRWNNDWKARTSYHLYDDEYHTDILIKVFDDGSPSEISANQRFRLDKQALQLLTDIVESKTPPPN